MVFNLRKKGIVVEYLPWLVIAMVVLVLILLAIFVLRDKGFSLIDRAKDLFRGF